jgi:hypothetical protein
LPTVIVTVGLYLNVQHDGPPPAVFLATLQLNMFLDYGLSEMQS